ncbi:MAG: P-II family nitrogen regulator [Hyphomicrobium sp.]
MEKVKRIEIIVPEIIIKDIVAILSKRGLTGYTITRGLQGKGDRGLQDGEGFVSEFANASVLVIAPVEGTNAVLEDLRTLLKRYGGMCLISDAQSLRH